MPADEETEFAGFGDAMGSTQEKDLGGEHDSTVKSAEDIEIEEFAGFALDATLSTTPAHGGKGAIEKPLQVPVAGVPLKLLLWQRCSPP